MSKRLSCFDKDHS